MPRNFTRVSLLGCLTLVFLAGCQRAPNVRKMAYMEAGRRLYDQKDYPRAILEFRNAVKLAAADPEPQYRLGLAYLATGDIAQAATSFHKAAQMDPKHAGAQLHMAELLTMASDPELLQDAVARLRIVLDTAPSANALHAMALAEMKLGQPEQADQYLEESLARFPKDLTSYEIFARSKILHKDLAGAEDILKRAVQAAPQSADAKLALGNFYTIAHNNAEAEKIFRAVAQADAKNGTARFDLAMLLYNEGRKAEAEQSFRELSTFAEPKYQALHAIYLFQEGKQQEGVDELEQLFRTHPKSHDIRTQLVAAYWVVGRRDDLRRLLNTALKQNPKDFDALLERGELNLVEGRYVEAQTDINEVLSFRPDSPQLHYVLAKLYLARGAEYSYRQELNQTIRLGPNLLDARVELAAALTAAKAPNSALQILEETPPAQKNALAVLTQRNWAFLALGNMAGLREGVKAGLAMARSSDLLIQNGWIQIDGHNYAAAQDSIEEALKKAPADTRGLEALTALYVAQKRTGDLEKRLKQYAAQSNSPAVQLFVGDWILSQGDKEGARAFFQAAKVADPKFHEADVALALMDISEGKLNDARSIISSLLAGRDQDANLRIDSAVLETAAHQYSKAVEEYRKVLAIDQNNLVALNNAAYLLANSNKPDEALAYAQQAREIAPDTPAVEDTLGWVLYMKGIYNAALSHLQSAAEKSSDPIVQYHLGLALLKSGDRSRGEQVLQKALKIAPNAEEASLAREAMGPVQ